jgi:hypothetical protein
MERRRSIKGVYEMSADSLYDDIRRFLRLSTRVTSKTGGNINVGERFTVRFTASNQAYSANFVGEPRIIFNNPRIFVEGTSFASPVAGNGWRNVPDQILFPGESSFVDVEFTALSTLDWWNDLWSAEHIAKAWILADLDQNLFFQMWNYADIHEEIEPT